MKSIHNIVNNKEIPQHLFEVKIAFYASQLKSQVHLIYGLRYLLNMKSNSMRNPLKGMVLLRVKTVWNVHTLCLTID